MKVAFNARLLYAPTLRGWNRYTVNLLAELPKLGVELYLYSDRPIHPDHLGRLPQDSYQIRLESGLRYPVWEQYWLPRQCQKDQIDILHSPFNFGLPWISLCPRVLTLHDAIAQVYYGSQAQWQQKFQPQALQMSFHNWVAYTKAEAIITVSNHAKGDLIKYLGIPDRKISVIYEAADPNFHQPLQQSDRSLVRAKYNLNFPYIFYVGGWEQRKNIPFLLKAFAQAKLDHKLQGVKLVLAGGSEAQKIELQDLAIALNISESLELLGWVEEEDLPILYAEALCFVYPSEYEGFGLQLCEAMAVGCPVLAANSTCLPEILGNGGQLFDLESSHNLKELMQNINADQQFLDQLKISVKQRSQDFSWGKTAQQTLGIYRLTLLAK
jgi:glycosyltransferase involved in cell wall biosynthesis